MHTISSKTDMEADSERKLSVPFTSLGSTDNPPEDFSLPSLRLQHPTRVPHDQTTEKTTHTPENCQRYSALSFEIMERALAGSMMQRRSLLLRLAALPRRSSRSSTSSPYTHRPLRRRWAAPLLPLQHRWRRPAVDLQQGGGVDVGEPEALRWWASSTGTVLHDGLAA